MQRDGEQVLVPADEVAWLSPSVLLNSPSPAPYTPSGDELWLRRQVLDRQIVDVEGRRIVRVNDLQLARRGRDSRYRLVGVNVGTFGLARRLGVGGTVEKVYGLFRREVPDASSPGRRWPPVQVDAPSACACPRPRRWLHPVDLANIVSDLDLLRPRPCSRPLTTT